MIGDLIVLIIAGLVIGGIARLVIPGRQAIGLLRTLLLGVAGAVIGGLIASLVDAGEVFELNFIGFVLAAVASVILLAAGERSGVLRSGGRRRLERGRHR